MKFYIGTINGTGIEIENFEEFVNYLKDISQTLQSQGENCFEITIENELKEERTNLKYHVYNIEWDTDEENTGLPKEVIVELATSNDENIEDLILDYLSDNWGYCVFGFNYEEE